MPKLLPEPFPTALGRVQPPYQPQFQQFMGQPFPGQSFPNFGGEQEQSESSLPLTHYLWILKRHLWKIVAFVVLCTMATFVVTNRMTSVYESTTTIDIDRQAQSTIVGQDSSRGGGNPFDSDQFLATQIKLLQ